MFRLSSIASRIATGVRARAAPAVFARYASSQDRPFDKILIANRGEIACRVMNTCDKMGIETVAVYSEADAGSKHVRAANESVFIGPAASAESYLRIDRIIEACKKTGAQAVHPGYGFLSENNAFQAALDAEGIKFIGPKAHAISVMGDKIESKRLAEAAKVNVIPGFVGEVKTEEDVVRISNEIGYPVMIKASAGGGGKGMRVAFNDKEAIEGFNVSKREAASSFGDDRMLIEKFIGSPRHIEFQVLADQHGNIVYLNERECSIQRRNQKVIEEAPSPFLDAKLRQAMGEQAVQLAAAVQYESAGTVEMLVNAEDRSFYFLEMNTRLQVEHPITEYITGVDIVEQMINVAAGRPLPFTQADIPVDGWAIESRVYAEDPTSNFMPSIGRLRQYEEPTVEGDTNIRCDSGVVRGSEISMFYDPMISKLVTYGETREDAIARNIDALDHYVIRGVKTNVGFLRDLLEHPRFVSGKLTTKFIEEEYPEGFHGREHTAADRDFVRAIAASMIALRDATNESLAEVEAPPAPGSEFRPYSVTLDGELVPVVVSGDMEEGFAVHAPNDMLEVTDVLWADQHPLFRAKVNGEPVVAQFVEYTYNSVKLQYNGADYEVFVEWPEETVLSEFVPTQTAADTTNSVLSPMPGKVIKVAAQPGDTVVAGQELLVVEAMKMQNVIRATRDGKVATVEVAQGDDVAVDATLITLDPL